MSHEELRSEVVAHGTEHGGEPASAADSDAVGSAAANASEHGAAEAAGVGEATVETQTQTQMEVGLVRSVRHLRIMLIFTALGAVVGAISALLFPVQEDGDYELGQVVGLAAVFGAVAGLAIGTLIALILGLLVKRSKGAAIAVQTDVR